MVNNPMTNPPLPLFNLLGNFFNKNFENKKISMEKILPVRFGSLNNNDGAAKMTRSQMTVKPMTAKLNDQ